MSASDWQPAASPKALKARACLLRDIRDFFAAREVLEVETPLLCGTSGTDPHLSPVSTDSPCPGEPGRAYLQTSPEFAMKRLLASGSGSIFQICKAFRAGERGRRHNPEFTMLEWYRQGMSLDALMDEVEALVSGLTGITGFQRQSYRDLFERHLDIDPFNASLRDLESLARERLDVSLSSADFDTWLDLLFSGLIEPELVPGCFIFDYPPSQAALARVEKDDDGYPVARRFELVLQGMEIANGYDELSDPAEQARRFKHDQVLRQQRGIAPVQLDKRLLSALEHGLPACCGVAVGLDRLLMIILQADSIDDVLSFPFSRA